MSDFDDLQHRWRDMSVIERAEHTGKYPLVVAYGIAAVVGIFTFPFDMLLCGRRSAVEEYAQCAATAWDRLTA